MRPFISWISLFVFFLIQAPSGIAQIPPPPALPPLQPIGMDPTLGQMCQGPLGPGRCEDVQRFLQIEQIAAQIQLQQTGFTRPSARFAWGRWGRAHACRYDNSSLCSGLQPSSFSYSKLAHCQEAHRYAWGRWGRDPVMQSVTT